MEWSRGPTVGRGASATVSVATTAVTGELFAVKSADLSRSSFLQREKQFLSQLSSPYVVQYRGDQITIEDNRQIYNVLMEFVPGGSISDATKKQGGSIDERMIRIHTNQILRGLLYLHDTGLVHCDIKGQNLVIGREGVKIADFGCAKWVEEDKEAATSAFSGTPAFMAPEVARGEEQGFPADVWALGCTVIEMATGSHPWQEEDGPVSALYRIGFSEEVPEFPEHLTDEAKDFLSKCLNRDPKQRFTVKELLQHPFVNDLELNSQEFDKITRVSPTTVLDQGFWDSLEVPGSRRDSTHISSGTNSPAERINLLIGSTSSSNSNSPNWDQDDEDWICVRINDVDNGRAIISELSHDVSEENRETVHTGSIVDRDETDNLIPATYFDDSIASMNCVSDLGEDDAISVILDAIEREVVNEDSVNDQFRRFTPSLFFSTN